jgi:hypothetical protein
MAEQHHLRRSKAGHAGSPLHAHLALLALVGATALLLVAAALTLIPHGLLGNRHASFSERIVGPPVSSTTGARSRVVTHHASSWRVSAGDGRSGRQKGSLTRFSYLSLERGMTCVLSR